MKGYFRNEKESNSLIKAPRGHPLPSKSYNTYLHYVLPNSSNTYLKEYLVIAIRT